MAYSPTPAPPPGGKRALYCDPSRKPAVLAVDPAGIPAGMTRAARWIAWALEWKTKPDGSGVWSKVPKSANGRNASSTDPATWTTFDAAITAYRTGRYAGLGFVLGGGFVGVDLDDVRDAATGELTATWAADLVGSLATYADVSPSGTGVKLFALGEWTGHWKKRPHPSGVGEIEVYDRGRFFCVTGHSGGPVAGLSLCQPALERLAGLFPPAQPPATTAPARSLPSGGGLVPRSDRRERAPGEPWVPPTDDGELLYCIGKSKQGAKFEALWEGRWQAYYASQSEADLGLASLLAWWTQNDHARIDRLFRQSALMRDKWLERRGALTYAERTIQRVTGG